MKRYKRRLVLRGEARTRSVALLLIPFLVWVSPAHAQTAAHSILRARVVMLDITESGASGECMGMRLQSDALPSDSELVLTAAHCITNARSIAIHSLDGNTEYAGKSLRWAALDVAFVMTAPPRIPSPFPTISWGRPYEGQRIVGIIRVGSGEPTPASELVLDVGPSKITVAMPAGPGTSGAPVLTTDPMIAPSGAAHTTP